MFWMLSEQSTYCLLWNAQLLIHLAQSPYKNRGSWLLYLFHGRTTYSKRCLGRIDPSALTSLRGALVLQFWPAGWIAHLHYPLGANAKTPGASFEVAASENCCPYCVNEDATGGTGADMKERCHGTFICVSMRTLTGGPCRH